MTKDRQGGWGENNERDQHCPECGKVICGGRVKTIKTSKCPNKVCHTKAGAWTDHVGVGPCARHMGLTPSQRNLGNEAIVRREMRRYGVPVEIDAEDALREEIHRTVGHVRWLAEKVAQLGEDDAEREVAQHGGEPRAARVIDVGDQDSTADRSNVVSIGGQRIADPDGDEDDYASAGESRHREVEKISVSEPRGDQALVWGIQEREIQAGGEGGGFDRVKIGGGANAWLQVYMAERGHLAKITDIAMKADLKGRKLEWAESMASRLIDSFENFAILMGEDPKSPEVQLKIATSLEALVGLAS